MAAYYCVDLPMEWDAVISWFKEEMRGKSLKSCLQIMFWSNSLSTLETKKRFAT